MGSGCGLIAHAVNRSHLRDRGSQMRATRLKTISLLVDSLTKLKTPNKKARSIRKRNASR